SAASSGLSANASSEREGVPSGGVWSPAASSGAAWYGCSGVLSSAGSPSAAAGAVRSRPQLVQMAVPGSLYASQRRQTSPNDEDEAAGSSAVSGGASSCNGALQRLHS